jgi:hypothetical protein
MNALVKERERVVPPTLALLKEDEVIIKLEKKNEFLYAKGKIGSQCSLTPAFVIGWYGGRIIIYCVGHLIM